MTAAAHRIPYRLPRSLTYSRSRVHSRQLSGQVQQTVDQVQDVAKSIGIDLGLGAKRKPRQEGTIASVFASLSAEGPKPLPDRFAALKREIVHSPQLASHLEASWVELCNDLRQVNESIVRQGADVIPSLDFDAIASSSVPTSTIEAIKRAGTCIVRGVVPRQTAETWLNDVQEYIRRNPQVKGFPEDDKQVFEIYWSRAQLQARSHPRALTAQQFLLSLFNASPNAASSVSLNQPLTYCDRLRIRLPGDAKFALGPHVDGGSVERWEDPHYRSAYGSILKGRWRDHDAWDIGGRALANMNLYDGPGSCGVFRALQGWTSLSTTRAGEGTLRVYPALKHGMAYMLLRPFFQPVEPSAAPSLDSQSWKLDLQTSDFPKAPLGRSQEFDDASHPHLELSRTMTSLGVVNPGDTAWWHCDTIHSVESQHSGKGPSAVFYIPAVPLTVANAEYIASQRDSFEAGIPPPDFPGGEGESRFVGKGGEVDIVGEEGRMAMGLQALSLDGADGEGARALVRDA